MVDVTEFRLKYTGLKSELVSKSDGVQDAPTGFTSKLQSFKSKLEKSYRIICELVERTERVCIREKQASAETMEIAALFS